MARCEAMVAPTNNPDVPLQLLFEQDSFRVYRS